MQLLELMDGYFKPDRPKNLIAESTDIQDSSGFDEWQRIDSPDRLIRDYQFSSRPAALEFLRQLLLYEDSIGHHAKIVIEYDSIRVEVYTHDINMVTEQDIEYATVTDQIYMDTNSSCQNI